MLIADLPTPAALRDVSATGAFLETNARPPLGAGVELQHPEAGAIAGTVCSVADDGIAIGFEAASSRLPSRSPPSPRI
ncbi:hypothetical protein [Sphingosinicella humi]|uniref:hypothetical protein n=1 Tax=Allosphingosinicella humi TaxID=2068657 RepID=UPI0011B23BDC|nr:hypothetical protein [Sphingosinicella humi]